MKKVSLYMLIGFLFVSCFSPKRDAEYTDRDPIPTEGSNTIKLIITEERYTEPPVATVEQDGVPKPVKNWLSKEMLEYRIGPGDVVRVIILVSLDASSYEVMVASDGTVVLPLIGPFPLGGSTIEESREIVRQAYNQYYVNPQIQLRVTQYNSQKVYIMGAGSGSTYELNKRTTLFEVINTMGKSINSLDTQGAYLMRDNKIYPLFLDQLLEGDFSTNYEVVHNDILFIPSLSEKKVYLLGEVGKPGMYTMEKNENLFYLLAKAGGPRPGAQLREIRIIRGGLEDPILLTVNIQPMMKRRPTSQLSTSTLTSLAISVDATRKNAISLEKLYLHDGDIIFVPPTALEKWNQIIGQISPSITFAFTRPILVARDLITLGDIVGY